LIAGGNSQAREECRQGQDSQEGTQDSRSESLISPCKIASIPSMVETPIWLRDSHLERALRDASFNRRAAAIYSERGYTFERMFEAGAPWPGAG
jgi:hypothetical protein